ncbi:MAG: hypothetical protein IT383_11270 [Deltaproteobacteria bacterium]|nr:hypothetical protein [Deltaproteobacteria bacterium]
MSPDGIRLVVILVLAGAALGWLLLAWIYRVTGTWERVLSSEEHEEGVRAERITLGQFGPFVTGRRDVAGGYQQYSGMLLGPRLTLTRRDHGKASLMRMGFPDAVADKLEGEVMANLKLRVVDGGLFLDGAFEPLKVEFTHQPPRITGMVAQAPQRRRYRRVQPLEERVPAFEEQAEASEA